MLGVEMLPILMLAVLAALACAAAGASPGAGRPGQHARSFKRRIRKTVGGKFLLYLPRGYGKTRKRWPLVLFLHGAGERGDDLDLVKLYGPPKLVAHGRRFPFILVSPQCPAESWWPAEVDMLEALLDEIVDKHAVDEDRIYVTGLSMGGFGTWALAIDQPDRFAAVAPICGRGDPHRALRIKHLPVWVFHGAKDETVPLACSREMVEALKAAGARPRFTVYPMAGHDSWTAAYNNPKLYQWLLRQRRKT